MSRPAASGPGRVRSVHGADHPARLRRSTRQSERMSPTRSAPESADGQGDADLAALGSVLAEPPRARMLLALGDGRALSAGVLAAEAGVAPSTASTHLSRLLDAGLVTMHPQGRHRYYVLAGPEVGELIETLAGLAPPTQIRSLREGTRAHALRQSRTCYDHLAGRWGVALFAALLEREWITGGDGRHDLRRARTDRLSGPGRDFHYVLTPAGQEGLRALDVELPAPDANGMVPLRYCVDWSEQAHHLSGAVGRALTARLFDLGWLRRIPRTRATQVTEEGARRMCEHFGFVAP